MFGTSPGSYGAIEDRSFVVNGSGILSGGIVISAKRGPVELNEVYSATEFVNTYGLPSRDNPSLYAALRFLSTGTVLTVRRVINDAVVATGALRNADDTDDVFTVTAENPGSWANNVVIKFADVVGEAEGVFALLIEENGNQVERFVVSRDPSQKDGYGKTLFIEDVVNNQSDFIRIQDNATVTEAVDVTKTVALAGGTDDTVAPTSGSIVSAWSEFEDEDAVSALLLINAGWTAVEVQTKMLSVAQTRGHSVAILDVPKASLDVEDAIAYRNDELGANTYFGDLYAPWIRVYDEYNDLTTEIPPSGDVAARFVYSLGINRWTAPAGLQGNCGIIPNALGVSVKYNEGQRDRLYTNGINPIISLSGTNAVIWGQKTLQVQSSAMDRANVVNNVLWMEKTSVDSLQRYVFVNNTKYSRSQVFDMLDRFYAPIKAAGGVYDYRIVVDSSNNTSAVIEQNQMLVDIYVQPVRAGEFIKTTLIVTRTGVDLGKTNN